MHVILFGVFYIEKNKIRMSKVTHACLKIFKCSPLEKCRYAWERKFRTVWRKKNTVKSHFWQKKICRHFSKVPIRVYRLCAAHQTAPRVLKRGTLKSAKADPDWLDFITYLVHVVQALSVEKYLFPPLRALDVGTLVLRFKVMHTHTEIEYRLDEKKALK